MRAHGAPALFLPPQRPTGAGRLRPLRHGHRGAGTAGGEQEAAAAAWGKNTAAVGGDKMSEGIARARLGQRNEENGQGQR